MAAKTRGIGAHTDFGALTLLLQDDGSIFISSIQLDQKLTRTVGGLEVYYEPDDIWYPIPYVPDAFVVNIGDMLGKL
jgi:isopenicillin N synthase-like dioxygenase